MNDETSYITLLLVCMLSVKPIGNQLNGRALGYGLVVLDDESLF